MDDLLVIVPCGRSKVWDKSPDHGPTPVRDAYTGSPFKVNREYAECVGTEWLVLSAKYGFIAPDAILSGPYNVTFKRKSSGPVSVTDLREQVKQLRLDRFATVIGLGGKEYRQAVESAFAGTNVELRFPFAGLPIGKAMQATKRAIQLRDACGTIHEWFNQLWKHHFPFQSQAIPQNGIYILFQEGETAHGMNRIVRVGTHTADRQLRSRLRQHFVKENKDRSIFRKNIGRCLLNEQRDPFLECWNFDLTSRAS